VIVASEVDPPLPVDAEARLVGFTELFATALADAEAQAALSASRVRLVAAAGATHRRIERDLPDAAAAFSLALELRAVRAAVPPEADELTAQLDGVAAEIDGVLDELRDIARGLRPAALADGGLRPALKTLARRSAVPVRLDVRVGGQSPGSTEVAACYVVAEALTNVAKHAHATVVDVEVDAGEGILPVRGPRRWARRRGRHPRLWSGRAQGPPVRAPSAGPRTVTPLAGAAISTSALAVAADGGWRRGPTTTRPRTLRLPVHPPPTPPRGVGRRVGVGGVSHGDEGSGHVGQPDDMIVHDEEPFNAEPPPAALAGRPRPRSRLRTASITDPLRISTRRAGGCASTAWWIGSWRCPWPSCSSGSRLAPRSSRSSAQATGVPKCWQDRRSAVQGHLDRCAGRFSHPGRRILVGFFRSAGRRVLRLAAAPKWRFP
jgi:hypothetical protein